MDNGYSRFIGVEPNPDDWTIGNCKWTSYQWLCPQETGGGLVDCWTVLPASVYFECASGYAPVVGGQCRANPPIEQPCNCPDPGRRNPTVGNPIVLSTGAKVLSALDYETADGDFRIGREYRSFQVGRPISGVGLPRSLPRWLTGGWNFDFGYEIQLGTFSASPSSPNARVAILAPDGTGFGFVLQAGGAWIPDPTIGAANTPNYLKLEYVGTFPSDLSTIKSAASTWKLTDGNDTVWTFQTRVGPNGGSYNAGWPTQRRTREGYAWNFTYNGDSSLASITDSFSRTANFTWNKFYTTSLASPPAGTLPYPQAVASISLPDGTSLKYTYDPAPATSAPSASRIQRLVKVERLSAASAVLDSTTYLYEDSRFPKYVTGVIDNRAIRVATYAYDAKGRATSTSGANGANSYAVEYNTIGTALTRRVTNALGKAETYTFSAYSAGPEDYRLTGIGGAASANTPASSSAATFGTDTFVADRTDEEGRLATTIRDAKGRPTTTVEASGTTSARTTTTTYHATLNVPVSIVRSGLTETRTYNAAGQLQTVTLTDTTTQTIPYSTNGQTRTYTYGWDANGRLQSVNGPLAANGPNDDITSYGYNPAGNLLTVTNALGQVTTFAGHDANGRPGTTTDPNGIVTAYTYDGVGRVKTITVQHPSNSALNATTTIGYDAVGQVTGITLPSSEILIMDYDGAGRMISMRAGSGERWDYTYDGMGNVTQEVAKRNDGTTFTSVQRSFDELGRQIREARGRWRPASSSYDKVGNEVGSTSANGRTSTTTFDALDRVIKTVAPDSGNTDLTYDARDNLLSHSDPKSVTTQFSYNGFGEVIREVSPDRGTSTYVYDAAGRLLQATDGRDQLVTYTRDYLGRVTGKLPQGKVAETVTYSWDSGGLTGSYGVGRLAKVVDGSGTTKFKYDHRGNVLVKEQAIGSTTTAQLVYAYDLADRITQITYPSGRLVRYTYSGKGRVTVVETKASASVTSWTLLANGFSYEPFGAVKTIAFGNGLAVENVRSDDGTLASRRLYRTSGGTNVSHLTYRNDADGNIGSITDNVTAANSILYGYDATGRLSQTLTDASGAAAETYSYTTGTNRLASITSASGARSITYDARGNTATESRPGSVSVTTGYDGYARLTSYVRSGGTSLAFSYNGLDDRVTMVLGSSTRRFLYAGDGRVLGEYGASATDVKAEFIWAWPESGPDKLFGGNDGTGGYAPLAVATPDSLGAIQVNWVHGNHLGVPLAMTDSGGNAATTPSDYLMPGFPGQSRVLADLYYNRYRDYDPSVGRYVQADPIGLEGGSNPYLYADGNPVSSTDPNGLNTIVLGAGAGGAVGGPAGAFVGGILGGAVFACAVTPACRNFFVPKYPPRQPPRYPPINPPRSSPSKPKDCCTTGWIEETEKYCPSTFGRIIGAYRRCIDRANDRLRACKREGGIWPPSGPDRWSWQDENRFRL